VPHVNRPASLHKDFIARSLGSEVQFLEDLLKRIEQPQWPEDSYIKESLKMSRENLKGLIKYLSY